MDKQTIQDAFIRTEMLLGEEAMHRLGHTHVAVFGLGGVGSYVVEALARSGIGALTLVDQDRVDASNLNRQLLATQGTIGRLKTEVAAERVRSINSACQVTAQPLFFMPNNAPSFDFSGYDYVVDAVDTVTAKIELVMQCKQAGTPIISSMGTGNKLDPTQLKVADIYSTHTCPLARVMRRELKRREIPSLTVVFSTEQPLSTQSDSAPGRYTTPGTVAFVPSAAGLIAAGVVVRALAITG